MQTKRRTTAWLLASMALVFILVGVIFPAAACFHTCVGSHCPICLQLRVYVTTLRVFGAAALCVFSIAAAAIASHTARAAVFLPLHSTPVALKTKLSN